MVTGNLALAFALPAAIYAFLLSIFADKNERLSDRSRQAIHTVTLLVSIASIAIVYAFVSDSFDVAYVSQYSSLSLPLVYKFAGIWAGLEGSLLFWAWLLVICASIVAAKDGGSNITNAVLQAIVVFFLLMIVFDADPFSRLSHVPADGHGLNPLLQNFFMIIHPPALYIGYVGLAVPFAYVIEGLLKGDLRTNKERWNSIRRWTIVSWLFLTLGNLLGAMWAYVELGWGGFWGWDPVENAGILPWFAATAFLHSLIVQERRDMLRLWNVVLIMLSFLFTIFGTFITRSGIIRSVHSFSDMRIGMYFIAFLTISILFCAILVIRERKNVRGRNAIETMISREGAFYMNGLLFILSLVAILWGTMLPLFYEIATGQKTEVGAPYFNRVMAPIGIAMLFLTGIGGEMSWRRWRPGLFKKEFLVPTLLAFVAGIAAFAFGIRKWFPLCVAIGSVFVLGTIVDEFIQSALVIAKRESSNIFSALATLTRTAPRRYGGYIVHLGVILLFIGIAGSSYKFERALYMVKGDKQAAGGYEFVLNSIDWVRSKDSEGAIADISVTREGSSMGHLKPALFLHRNQQKPIAEVDLFIRPWKDVYLAMGSVSEDGNGADFELTINPLISCVWLGGIVMAIGTILAMLPAKRRKGVISGQDEEDGLDIALGRASKEDFV